MTTRCTHPLTFGLALAALFGLATAGATRADEPRPVPLAIVGPDTVTTTELNLELGLMQARNADNVAAKFADPKAILERLTQNLLIIQEGYRMGLDQEFAVRNEGNEAVRHECMKALLDSVALSIPSNTAEVHDKRRAAVQRYLAGLARTYNVTVDSTLLASLDYASADPAVQKRLRESTEVLANLIGGRKLTVADFSRELRFQQYHGLVGKPDAAERRDLCLRSYVEEVLANAQMKAQKMDRQPGMVLLRHRMERNSIQEETLRVLLEFEFKPTDGEVSHYYRIHASELPMPSRMKVGSLKVKTKEAASNLRARLAAGTSLRWLAENDKSVVQGPSPFPEIWLRPEEMGLKPADLKLNAVPEPYEVPDGWVVAQISAVEGGQPQPLEQCRDQVLAMMKRDATRDHLVEILARLRAASPVVILPGAEAEVTRAIEEFQKATAQPAAAAAH
jgi:hypothetical protein